MSLSTLPLEIIMQIHDFLPDWNDRLRFAKINAHIWYMSLHLRSTEPMVLNYSSVNPLELACSREIRLPDTKAALPFLNLLVSISYAVREFVIPESSSNKRFADIFTRQVSRRHDAAKISIRVGYEYLDVWKHSVQKHHDKVKVVVSGVKRARDVDLDQFDTPEEAKRTKHMIKELSVMAGTCALRASKMVNNDHSAAGCRSGSLVPFPVAQLIADGTEYELDKSDPLADDRLLPTTTLNLTRANELVKDINTKYMECVVLFECHWFLLTSFDAFIHGRPSIDDCADKTNSQYQHPVQARIIQKSIHGQSGYYELSIRLGNVELVAMGGFFGNDDHPQATAFLGSSIKGLPVALRQPALARRILTRRQPAAISTSNRHLRQYGKAAAAHEWSSHSKRFASKGLYPVNPLRFSDHPITVNGRGGAASQIGSSYLRCVASRSVDQADIDRMLSVALQDTRVKSVVKTMHQCTFRKVSVKTNGVSAVPAFMKTVISAAHLLERTVQRHYGVLWDMDEFGSMGLKVLNGGLAERITSANIAAAKMYTTNYGSHHQYEDV